MIRKPIQAKFSGEEPALKGLLKLLNNDFGCVSAYDAVFRDYNAFSVDFGSQDVDLAVDRGKTFIVQQYERALSDIAMSAAGPLPPQA